MAEKKAGLAYLKYEIARCERRIKKIKENPDPAKPKCNVMLYEAERELRLEQLNGVQEGKPFGDIPLTALPRALGMIYWDAIWAADRTYGEGARKYFDILRKEGMAAEHMCDRTIVILPMVLGGDFPRPSFLAPANQDCLPGFFGFLLIAKLLGIPYYVIDRHHEAYSRTNDDEKLKYVTDQLGELIEYVERNVPGCKYDESKLAELQYWDLEFIKCHRQLYELKKRVPCPVSGREAFREIRPPHIYPNPAKIVHWMRSYVEEVGEKAEKGLGAVEGEEKLRLLWSVSAPFYADPFAWLAKRGVSVPAAEMTVWNGWFSGREPILGDPWKGRRLSVLEEEARQEDYVWARVPGDWWANAHVNTCRDLGLDGIIYFLQWGCPISNGLGKVCADVAERELGIPTLLIAGRMLDESVFDEKAFFSQLEEFVGICLSRKKEMA